MTTYNSLALLALKVAPNVFDLSTGQTHISVRDQIVRGRLLATDLCAAMGGGKNMLVIGAGVGGVSAAIVAAAQGWAVKVVEIESSPFSLQKDVRRRYVGPFMYEWPHVVHDNQTYPPRPQGFFPPQDPLTPTWTSERPIRSNKLAAELENWLLGCLPALAGSIEFWTDMGAHKTYIASYVKKFVLDVANDLWERMLGRHTDTRDTFSPPVRTFWPSGSRNFGSTHWTPDYIVLAAGVGAEEVRLHRGSSIVGLPFWADDELRKCATQDKDVAVFGGGDGGLQDVLRALTRFAHPLSMLRFLRKDVTTSKLLDDNAAALAGMEQMSRLTGTWQIDKSILRRLDEQCAALAKDLIDRHPHVRDQVGRSLRYGTGLVTQFTRETYFTKAYLLNRFLVHLIHSYFLSPMVKLPGRMRYEWIQGVIAQSSEVLPSGKKVVRFGPETWPRRRSLPRREFDEVVVRYGIEADSVPAHQMINLNARDDGRRTALSQVPLPFVFVQ